MEHITHIHMNHGYWKQIVTVGLITVTIIEKAFPELGDDFILGFSLLINILWVWT